MKKTIILLACAFLVCLNTFAYDVDVIITKSREQIQCMIISQNGDTITYKSTYQDDQQVYKIAKSDVEKVFIHDKEPAKSTTTNTKPAPQKVVNDGQEVKKAVSQTASAAQSKVKSDLIITKDAKKIDAKIIEVSKNEIKYKELDNLEGPTFVLETKEISSIIYANGKVVLYNQKKLQASTGQETSIQKDTLEQPIQTPVVETSNIAEATSFNSEILLMSGQIIRAKLMELADNYVAYTFNGKYFSLPAEQVNKVTDLRNGAVTEYNGQSKNKDKSSVSAKTPEKLKGSRIYRDNGEYMYNNTYISQKEVARILERENSTAFKEWKKAEGMLIGGGVCVGIGGGLAIGGLITLIGKDPKTCLIMDGCALVPLGIGLGLTLGASSHYNKAIDIYNSKYDHAAVQLKWRVAPNQVGLAIAF